MVGGGEGWIYEVAFGALGEAFQAVARPAGKLFDQTEPLQQVVVGLASGLGHFCGVVDGGVFCGGAHQLDAADITGPLDRQVIEACRFIFKNMRMAAMKFLGRVDLPQYDMSAVFEALVNAVAHRDYSVHGSKIRLRMFEDRRTACSTTLS